MVEKSVINKIEKYIKILRELNLPITAVFLFGSQVKGNARADSDIDLLVVSPVFDDDRLAQAGVLWKAAWRVDTRIEPIPVGVRTFQTDHITPIYEIVRQEGLKIL